MPLQDDGEWRLVAYASRAMNSTEHGYAQIEKEALGITWASERFADYLIGLEFHNETDHKPLVPLLSSRNLEDLTVRVQRFRMRMMRFTYSISHVPGKLEADVQAYVDSIVKYLPATEDRLEDFKTLQQQDEITKQIITYCSEGWAEKSQLPGPLKVYWPERSDLTVQQGLLMKGNRLVFPFTMRIDVLKWLHDAHQVITKCRERAKASVCWPGLSHQPEEVVKNFILESVFGYQTKKSKGPWWTRLAPHALTQLKLPRNS